MISVNSLSELRFFTTPEHDCSYLDGARATTLFADPAANIDTALYTTLSALGFRRSGAQIYRPYCKSCTACIPMRVPVASFRLRRRHKRILGRNERVVISESPPSGRQEYFDLYERYINTRHGDGDMYPASAAQFESFLVKGRPEATFYEFREQDRLLAVAVADELDDGLSAIYTFFDPDINGQSLGVLAVLWLIEEVRRRELDYLYLGYWIKECQKMNYKLDYKPAELFIDNCWVPLS